MSSLVADTAARISPLGVVTVAIICSFRPNSECLQGRPLPIQYHFPVLRGMEPRVHHNKEVSLKLTIEVSQISGYVTSSDGSKQPIIGTRTITSSIRLKDGETNFLAGLIRKDTSKTKDTIPFLGDLPLIGQLFTHTSTDDKRTDLYLTLTPHIIRSPQITEEDLIPIWVGTENNVSFSGLNTRLESPNATGSPFDAAGEGAR